MIFLSISQWINLNSFTNYYTVRRSFNLVSLILIRKEIIVIIIKHLLKMSDNNYNFLGFEWVDIHAVPCLKVELTCNRAVSSPTSSKLIAGEFQYIILNAGKSRLCLRGLCVCQPWLALSTVLSQACFACVWQRMGDLTELWLSPIIYNY